VPHDHKFWERMLPMIRAGDPDELAHRLRHILGADPFRLTPRHWLAEVYRSRNQIARAIGEYDRLLPLAVGAGDLFRAIAVQKRIEELDARPGSGERFAAIHRWFRLLGGSHLVNNPSTNAAGISARALIRMPRDGFLWAANESMLETYARESRQIEIAGPEQHVLLWGELVWDVKLEGGRKRPETSSVEGDVMHVDPDNPGRGLLRVRPDTPAECLRFGAGLIEDLREIDSSIVHRPTHLSSEIEREERAMTPTKPPERGDLDTRARPPAEAGGDGPRRLELGDISTPVSKSGDIESWIGHEMLTLDSKPVDLSAARGSITEGLRMFDLDNLPRTTAPGAEESDDLTLEDLDRLSQAIGPSSEVPELDLGASGDSVPTPPVTPPAAPAEPVGATRIPSGPVRSAKDPGPPGVERRSQPRVALEIGGRVRLMGLAGGPNAAMECRVFDISQGGVGVVFAREDIHRAIAILEDEILHVELDVTEGEKLRLAARMRWVDPGRAGLVLAGLQFVLLAPNDLEVVARLVGSSAGASRKA
jgi:PilZ domain